MTTELEKLWHEAFDQCGAFVRDTALPAGFLEKYRVGLLLRERTFCDASYKIGGFVAPHRFLIISSNAKCLDEVVPQPWGLCVWQRGSFFKVIDKILHQDRAQISLLEIPETLRKLFAREELSALERSFVLQSCETFEQSVNADPVPELNTEEWRRRLVCPIGIDDQGIPFPLEDEDAPPAGSSMNFEIVGSSPTEMGDEIEVVDEIRRGDIVCFERVAPKKVAMRVLASEAAGNFAGRKYRIDRGSQPGTIKLIEVTVVRLHERLSQKKEPALSGPRHPEQEPRSYPGWAAAPDKPEHWSAR